MLYHTHAACIHSDSFHIVGIFDLVTLFERMRSLKADGVSVKLACAARANLRCCVSLLRPKLLQRFAAMAQSTAGETLTAVVT